MRRETSTRREFLRNMAASGTLGLPCLGLAVARGQAGMDAGQRERIEAALPAQAFVQPQKARRLLIFGLNVGYGGHRSIPTANLAFTLMGRRTGAFETVISKDPAVFEPESLKGFDAVFFNNNVGNLFEDPVLRQSLIDFVYGGGGLMGVHGTTVAFTRWPGAHEDWPEFGIMLGARGANHYDSDEHVFIKLDDPDHPLNQVFPAGGFDYRDEFFRVHGPYSRDRVRVLFSIDTQKTQFTGQPRGQCHRADDDYALAWVRQYGRGRVFYCTIAHNPYVFWDPRMLRFYLVAAQFSLGDLPAPTTPSARLTPAVQAQERLGRRLGLMPPAPEAQDVTFFESVETAAKLGLLHVSASNVQRVSSEIAKDFDQRLSPDACRDIRLKLDAAGVRLLTYRIERTPSNGRRWRALFDFGRRMGIEVFVGELSPAALATIEPLCDEYDVGFAVSACQDGTSRRDHPRELLEFCGRRGKRIGVCGAVVSWKRHGVEPGEAVRVLGERLRVVQVPRQSEDIATVLAEVQRLGIEPVMFGIEHPAEKSASEHVVRQSIECFNRTSIESAK